VQGDGESGDKKDDELARSEVNAMRRMLILTG